MYRPYRRNTLFHLCALLCALGLLACTPTMVAQESPTPTPEVFIPRTVAVPDGPMIAGQALWGTTPVAGARIELCTGAWADPAAREAIAQTTTDADGRYELDAPPNGGEFGLIALWPDGSANTAPVTPVQVKAGDVRIEADAYMARELAWLEPAFDAEVSATPTLRWSAVPGAAEYRLWVIDAGTTELVFDLTITTDLESEQTVTLPPLAPERTYTWYVQGLDAAANLLARLTGTFKVAQPTGTPTQAMPTLTPAGNDGTSMPSVTIDVSGVAQDLSSEVVAAVPPSADAPWWVPMPEYTLLTLQGYPIADHLMQPQIFVYPVQDLEVNEVAAQVTQSLEALLQNQQAGESMPYLPLYNAAQVMHTQVKYLDFGNGQGVRFLTWYSQGIMPINNDELLYTYQGLTGDGKYYVAVVLPVNLPGLPANWQDTSNLPSDFPNNYLQYLADTVVTLDQQPPSAFTPDLGTLDAMIQSIEMK